MIELGQFVLGEIPPPLEYQFLDADGVPIDLSGYTGRFSLRLRWDDTGTVYNVFGSPTVDGKVTYVWDGTEWPTAGEYWAEFIAGNGVNRYVSHRISMCVGDPVAPVPSI